MRDVWATALAAGVPDEVFWRSTPAETQRLVKELTERERQSYRHIDLLAGLIASSVYNASGRVKRKVRPTDFFREPEKDTPENLRAALVKWAHETPGVTVQ